MTNRFDADSWSKGAELVDGIRETWETQTFAASQAAAVTGDASISVDQAIMQAGEEFRIKWYDLIGNLGARLGSDHSKMKATADNYSGTEAEATSANQRFWGETS